MKVCLSYDYSNFYKVYIVIDISYNLVLLQVESELNVSSDFSIKTKVII